MVSRSLLGLSWFVNMRQVSACRLSVSTLVFCGLLLFSCTKQSPETSPRPAAPPTLVAAPALPQFTGTVGQFDAGANFVEFLRKNTDREIQLNITIPEAEFDGSNEADNSFFIIFDDCGEQPADEKPVAGPCTGTEVDVTNPDGPSLLEHDKGAWHLSGRFQVGEETGPLQGLMSIELERKLWP